jgi:uncharacterized protein (TIGR02246 family)
MTRSEPEAAEVGEVGEVGEGSDAAAGEEVDVAAALQRLLDIEALRRLKARYFRCIDTKDWEGFAQVFTEDAVLEVPEVDAVMEGREAIVSTVSAALAGATSAHHGHMPEIDVVDADTATGTWAMFDYVEWPPAETGERRGLMGFGHYLETYVRDGGVWRISRLHLRRIRIDPL